ncbi:MAG: hypothetical protein AB1752_05365 [Candidatus Zixiibacteriota bacterium]
MMPTVSLGTPSDQKTAARSRSIVLVAGVLLCLAPVGLALWTTHTFGINVCSFDEFRVAFAVRDCDNGVLGLDNLYAQHDFHRHFFPLALMVLIATLTGFNSVAAMYASVLFYLGIAGILWLGFRRWAGEARSNPLFYVAAMFILFSPAQFENFTSGFQLTYSMPMFFALAGFYLLLRARETRGRQSLWRFSLASLCAVIASFSSSIGLLLWIPALWILWPRRNRGHGWGWLAAWVAAGSAVWYLYFHGFIFFAEVAPRVTTGDIPPLLHFGVTLIGNTILYGERAAFWAGLTIITMLLLLVGWSRRRGLPGRHDFWIALAIYGLINAGSIAFARMAGGQEQAFISKYTLIGAPVVIGLLAMALDLSLGSSRPVSKAIIAALLFLMGAGVAVSAVNGFRDARSQARYNCMRAFILTTFDTQPDRVLEQVMRFQPRFLRPVAEYMREKRYNVFAEQVIPECPEPCRIAPAPTFAGVLAVNGGPVDPDSRSASIPLGSEFALLEGWALDPGRLTPASGVIIEIDGRRLPVFYGSRSPESVRSLKSPGLEYCGFERAIDLAGLGPGRHDVGVRVISGDGTHCEEIPVVVQLDIQSGP